MRSPLSLRPMRVDPFRFRQIALLGLVSLGCRGQPDGHDKRVASAAAPVESAAPFGPASRVVRCGWGSVQQGPQGDSPPWLLALLDVQSEDPLPGLSVVGAELLAEGKPITKIGGSPGLRVQQAAPTDSLAAVDTAELRGALPGGSHRVRVATRLEGTLVELQGRYPDRCRVVLGDETGRTLTAEGKLEPPWEPPAHPGAAASASASSR